MEKNISKCSSIEHKEIDAIKFCQECKKYFCNKCDKFHSSIFTNHHPFSLDKDPNEIFTGLCKIENHSGKLEFYCKDHNELCCGFCITKIKKDGLGQHTNCKVCIIEDIFEEKKNNLDNNIKTLENLSETFKISIKELNEIIENIDKNKEEIKLEIQKIFTKIRNELNNREDQLLLEVDEKFKKKFFNEDLDIYKEKDKFSNKIKLYIEKGKLANEEFNKNNNKSSLINDCINIEKIIENMNKVNKNMNIYKNNNGRIKFISNIDEIIRLINNFGNINSDENKIQNEININIQGFESNKIKYIKKITDKCGYGQNYYVYDGICFFISKNKEHVLAYIDSSSDNKSIIFYDINSNNEIKKINKAHNKSIHIIKYYDYSLYDLILSSSCNDDIKIWNYNECLNILTISPVFNDSSWGVFSSCLIIDKNISHIFCVGNLNYIKVYDSNGILYKNIGRNDEDRRYIDLYETNEKKYIISGGDKGIMVYNYPDLTEYYRFIENNDSNFHNYAKIIKVDDIYNLIDVGDFNKIKIWNFYNKTLIANISTNNSSGFAGFITINNRYLIIGSFDGSIKEFDIHERILIKSFNNQHSNKILGIKIIKDKNGKNNLVSYGKDKNILLWSIE